MTTTTEEKRNYLTNDYITVPGQNYALISVVSPDSNQKAEQCGIKIRGVFNSRQEADAHARTLQQADPDFDIYLVDMYKWLLVPPDPSKIEDQEYQEELLNGLLKGYRQNQLLAKQHFEERKASVMQEGLEKNLLPHERIAPPPEVVMPPAAAVADEPPADA